MAISVKAKWPEIIPHIAKIVKSKTYLIPKKNTGFWNIFTIH